MTHHLIGTVWEEEPPTTDEIYLCGSWGPPGFQAWNGMSPEVEICELAARLCLMLHPAVVIETGVGQGYVTRRLGAVQTQDQTLLCFEEDVALAEDLGDLPFFFENPNRTMAPGSPTDVDFSRAMLCVLDAELEHRERELALWMEHAPKNSSLLLHDCNINAPLGAPSTFKEKAEKVASLNLPGQFLGNPRGGFLGFHP